MNQQNYDIQGSANISRNLNVGGQANINGSTTIGHNLIVKGWLDAKNIKGPNKGIFLTAAKLREAYPLPHDGWWALVGNTLPAPLYISDGGAWVNTGETAGNPTIDSEQYNEAVADLDSRLTELSKSVNSNGNDIALIKNSISTLITNVNNATEAANAAQTKSQSALNTAASASAAVIALESRHSSDIAEIGILLFDGIFDGTASHPGFPLEGIWAARSSVNPEIWVFESKSVDATTLASKGYNVTTLTPSGSATFANENHIFRSGNRLYRYDSSAATHTGKLVEIGGVTDDDILEITKSIPTGSLVRFDKLYSANESPGKIESVSTDKSSTSAGCSVVVIPGETGPVFALRYQNVVTASVFYGWEDADRFGIVTDGICTPDPSKVYLETSTDTVYIWSVNDNDLAKISGGAATGNLINVNEVVPLAQGVYDLASAIRAVPAELRAPGRWVTYLTGSGDWETKRFVPSDISLWENPDAWEDTGGKGRITGVKLNGDALLPDADGVVDIRIDEVQVDTSLDPDSDNPISNRAISERIARLEASAVGELEIIAEDDGSVKLRTLDLTGNEKDIQDLPAASGGSSDSAAKIILSASVNHPVIREGSDVHLTYFYDHQYIGGDSSGESTGTPADITVEIVNGGVTVMSRTVRNVTSGSHTLDISKSLLAGENNIYVRAEVTDPDTGDKRKKSAFTKVAALSLTLTTSYNLANSISGGGYRPGDNVSVPFTITGPGRKTVTLYLDGTQAEQQVVTRSGRTNGTFLVDPSPLTLGRHNIQLVAEIEEQGVTVTSESIYIDINKIAADGSGTAPFVGTLITFPDGRIFSPDEWRTPVIPAGQYERLSFLFVAYEPSSAVAAVDILADNVVVNHVTVPRSTQTFANRYTETGDTILELRCGSASFSATISVTESGIDIAEAQAGLLLKLDASGRSNTESNPAIWQSDDVSTSFDGFDWQSSGWTGTALRLTNGAKAVIGYKPFENDVKATGITLELTIRVSNPVDRTATLIECLSEGKGLRITGEEIAFLTGQKVTYTNEDDQSVERDIKLASNYPAGDGWLKVALTISTAADHRLMQLFVNGNRYAADIYGSDFNFAQDTPRPITITSDTADVEIRSVRVYSRALSDDEELDNHMADSLDAETLGQLYEDNDVLGDFGDIDMEKLLAKGKGALRIVRSGKLDDVYATNDKKADFLADVYFYSPFGAEHNFVLTNCYIRIQGTSSTKYPSKNLRIYFSKGSQQLTFSGQMVAGGKFPLRPGSVPVSLVCCKADYSDSSMSLNTGGAKLFNDTFKELGLFTPPQRHQFDAGGGDISAVTVRSAIDGFPVDIFVAESVDSANEYVGQYNFNNEKSKSGAIFGMEGVDGYTPACPIALEMLNNTSPVCLFDTTSDEHLASVFDAGAEVNYGIDASGKKQSDGDVKWAGLHPDQQAAIRRLYSWLRSCVPAGADPADISTFVSAKFKSEISQYFDKDYILTYYIDRFYAAGVDQFAKNMMLRTWDGKIWYLTYYDGDTALGGRNDCFIVYPYTVDRTFRDLEANKFAMEGHDSVLWNLCLANFADDLRTCAANYRAVLSVDRALSMYNDEQSGNWCDRIFNKSGEIKYIRPAVQEMYGKVWPYIYALHGSGKSYREYFIRNRFALLDAMFGVPSFTSDNIDLYMARAAADTPDTVRIVGSEVYAFGYGTNNSPNIANTGIVNPGDDALVSITGAYTINDPLRLYGASRIKTLDMTGAPSHLKNGFDLGKCTMLQELDMSVPQGKSPSSGWWLSISSCRSLRSLNLNGQANAKTGGSSSTTLDLSAQPRLEFLDARGVNITGVTFAKGAPLTEAHLPGTITNLRLEYLSRLTMEGLTIASGASIRTLVLDMCPLLDVEALLNLCPNVTNIRITGVDRDDDGTWLRSISSLGGVDAEGSFVDYCAIVGTVRLTKYPSDEELTFFKSRFPELTLKLPEFTVICYDEDVADPKNISNLDNSTGYQFGNTYTSSGHISRILEKRHRVMAKIINRTQMMVYQLDDNDSRKYYPEGTEANVAGPLSETMPDHGDVMVYEPERWFKGVDDFINNKFYACFASDEPSPAMGKKITWREMEVIEGKKVHSGSTFTTLDEALFEDTAFRVYICDIPSNAQMIRWPAIMDTYYGAVFLDSSGNRISGFASADSRIEDPAYQRYLFTKVPQNASRLAFTYHASTRPDFVWVTESENIYDIEPEVSYSKEVLCSAIQLSLVNNQPRSVNGAVDLTANPSTFADLLSQRFLYLEPFDLKFHTDVLNLYTAKYGDRDSQMVLGRDNGTNIFEIGMRDTFGKEAVGAFIKGDNEDIKVPGVNCLGYIRYFSYAGYGGFGTIVKEFLYNSKTVVSIENDPYTFTPDGVPSVLRNGKYMSIIPIFRGSPTLDTYFCCYCDSDGGGADGVVTVGEQSYWRQTPEANGIYTICLHHSQGRASRRGRFLFRGDIVWAKSAQEFIDAEMIA